eukprot:g16758.t1
MDRRVLLVAEPAPLVYRSSSSSSSGGGGGVREHDVDPAASIRLDLAHLRSVIDVLSAYCRSHHHHLQHQNQEKDGSGGNCAGGDNGLPSGKGVVSVVPRNQQADAVRQRQAPGSSSGGEGSISEGDDGGLLLAAVFPFPALSEDCAQYQQRRRPQRDSHRVALADALESCALWLPPEEFEARVLAPTRALIDLQLEDLRRSHEQREIGGTSDAAEITVCGRDGDPLSSAGGSDTGGVRDGKRPGLPTCEDDTAMSAAAAAEAFVRSAADDVSLLVDLAAAGRLSEEASGVLEGGEMRAAKTRRSCMFDVLWAAASPPVEGSHDKREDAQSAVSPARPTPVPSSPPLPPLTLSAAVERHSSHPLRAALRYARTRFPQARLTILPAGAHIHGIPGKTACCGTGGSGGTAGGDSGGRSSGAGFAAPIGEAACTEMSDGTRASPPPSSPSGTVEADGQQRVRQQWTAWCESTGARLAPVSSAATGARAILDAGLLWRGPVVAGSAKPGQVAGSQRPAQTVAVSTSARSASLQPAASASPAPMTTFPALDGFALRMSVAQGNTSASGEDGGSGGGGAGGGRGAAGIARAAASVLGRSPALRLARAVSPTEVARVCHLLADGDLAPPLELHVEDEDRFPGSAEFLRGWAANGRGMLLVAEAASAAGGLGRGDGGSGGGGEGLAMVCFPRRSRCGSVGNSDRLSFASEVSNGNGEAADGLVREDAEEELRGELEGRHLPTTTTSWSVTLFRRPSEFSEAAVSALVGDRRRTCVAGGSGSSRGFTKEASAALPPSMPTSRGHRRRPGDPDPEEGGQDKPVGAIVSSLPVFTSASLLSEARRVFNPAPEREEDRQDREVSAAAAGMEEPPSPNNPCGTARNGRKRRRPAPAPGGGSGLGGRSGCRGGGGAMRKSSEASEGTEPQRSLLSDTTGRRRWSSRIVELSSSAVAAAAAAAAEAESETDAEADVEVSRKGRGGRRRGKRTAGEKGERLGDGERVSPETKLEQREAVSAPVAAAAAAAAAMEEAKLNAAMDAWAARLQAANSDLDSAPQASVPASRRNVGRKAEGTPLDGSAVPLKDVYLSGQRIPSAASLAYALYGSFGDWRGAGTSGVGADIGSPHRFWAEELLLPGDGGMSASRSTAPLDGCAAAAAAVESAEGAVAGNDSATEDACGGSRKGSRDHDGGRASANTGGGGDGHGGASDHGAGGSGTAATNKAHPPPPQPPRRALSTAEEVLEKAGQRQRARVKERRVVAREQRARMDRPRPRPRPRPQAAAGGTSASSRVATASGGAGGAGFRRRGSSGAPPPPTLGAVGRSGSVGSKLSRGSLILGRSVAAAGGPGGVVGAGSGASGGSGGQQEGVARRGGKGGAAVGSGSGGLSLGPLTQQQQQQRGRRDRAHSVASSSSSSSVSSSAATARNGQGTATAGTGAGATVTAAAPAAGGAAGGGSSRPSSRVRRAIFQDPPPAGAIPAAAVAGGGAPGPNGSVGGGERAGLSGASGAESRRAGDGDAAGTNVAPGGGGGGSSIMRQVMERAMLAAVAAQMSLPEDDPSVREVVERESRLMGAS